MTRLTSRRRFLTGAAAMLATPAILRATRAYAGKPVLRVGHVSPRTGLPA
jgi:branched-chain amino acid transport system substrate-binding protein